MTTDNRHSPNKKRIFESVDLSARSMDAVVSVGDSFSAAIECLPSVLEGIEQLNMSEAILLCGYALLHQQEMHHEDMLDAAQDIIESLDYMATSPKNADVRTKPTERETAIIFEALKKDFIGQMTTVPTEAEHLAAMQRISLLSKGGMHE